MFKLKLLAVLGFLGALFAFGKHKESQGKAKEKAKQTKRVVKNVKKAKKARSTLTPDKRKRLRDRHND